MPIIKKGGVGYNPPPKKETLPPLKPGDKIRIGSGGLSNPQKEQTPLTQKPSKTVTQK